MTPRPHTWTWRTALVLTVALGLTAVGGCDPRQAAYFLQPFEPQIAPPCPALKGKRVVLIAKAAPGATGDFISLDRDIVRELGTILKQKVKKIDLVNQDRVWTWDQAHPTWSDPAELGEAFDADMVVFLEIQNFQIQSPSSPEMLEGRSSIHVRVIERAHPLDDRGRPMTDKPIESKVIYDGDCDSTFPSRGPQPVSADLTPTAFKNRFLKLVSNEVSWQFVEHAPGDEIQEVRF